MPTEIRPNDDDFAELSLRVYDALAENGMLSPDRKPAAVRTLIQEVLTERVDRPEWPAMAREEARIAPNQTYTTASYDDGSGFEQG